MPVWAHVLTLRGLLNQSATPSLGRITLSDLMILTCFIAFATAGGTLFRMPSGTENWMLLVSFNLFAVLMWFKCLRLMNQNGIVTTRSRVAMQTLVFPSSILSLSVFGNCCLNCAASLIASLIPNYNDPVERHLLSLLLLLGPSYGWLRLTRYFFKAILKSNQAELA